jgi:uncharacterized membrane protein
MLTIFAVVLRILSNPLANVFQKQLASNHAAPLFINCITYLFLSGVSTIYALSISWKNFTPAFWLYALAVGFLGALGNGFLIKALQQGDLSVLGPINAYKAVVSLIASFFLLGENTWPLGLIWNNTDRNRKLFCIEQHERKIFGGCIQASGYSVPSAGYGICCCRSCVDQKSNYLFFSGSILYYLVLVWGIVLFYHTSLPEINHPEKAMGSCWRALQKVCHADILHRDDAAYD